MRFKMDLYANVRPVRLMDASLCPLKGVEPKDIDFVVIRENTEGVYGNAGGVFKQGTATKLLSRKTSIREREWSGSFAIAFEYCARKNEARRFKRARV